MDLDRHRPAPGSTVARFRRHYLVASVLPLLLCFLLVLFGASVARDRLAQLIADSTAELNADAERSLRELGEAVIRTKARDVAKELAVYFRTHPGTDLRTMREDPRFMELAIQRVGKTGYTAVTEAADTYRILAHPNPRLNGKDMREFAEKMPSWWEIVQAGITGEEASGYYEWIEADGSVREKYLVTTPVEVPVEGVTLMVSATTYIDEFSEPIAAMHSRAAEIDAQYQEYVSEHWLAFSIAFGLVVLSTLVGTFLLATRAARRFIDPIGKLAHAVRESDAGSWNTRALEPVAQRGDEIGTLAQAFQRLSCRTEELFHRLEQRLGELKETRDALRESEEHYRQLYEEAKQTEAIYRSLIHSSADAIVMADLDLRVTYLSPTFTQIFGWTEEELLGGIIPYVPESEQPRTEKILGEVVANGRSVQGYETMRLTKDGEFVDVSISASRFEDHQGCPAGVLAILRDISEKKRVEEQMRRIDRLEAIGTLAGGVAHDFNNLLTIVQGEVSLLKSELVPSGECYESLLEIEEQVRSGASLTRQLLGYARKGRYEVQVADLNAAVHKIAETVRRTRKDVVVHYDLAPDLHAVEADFHQLEQVLLNLDINACEAMPDGGELRISTRNVSGPSGPMVRVSVEDTGTGMEPDVVDRIFDPFFTTKALGHGTGLGLASAYGIVEGHGGRIEVDSQPGEGSVFHVYMPASTAPFAEAPEEPGTLSKGQGTVLVVDDEASVLEVCARMVQSLGYEVITASDGREAVEIYRARCGEIDLVLLDMVMPFMSGSEVFDRLREIDPQAVVVLSSGYSIDDKATETMIRECGGHLQKPYGIEQLAARLSAALQARRDAHEDSGAGSSARQSL